MLFMCICLWETKFQKLLLWHKKTLNCSQPYPPTCKYDTAVSFHTHSYTHKNLEGYSGGQSGITKKQNKKNTSYLKGKVKHEGKSERTTTYQIGRDVAQLLSVGPAHRWGRFDSPVRQGIFHPESTFSADSLTVSLHPRVQSHTLTSVCKLKIL